MTQPIDIEAEKLAATFKPKWRPLAFGLGVNFLLIALLFGIPYVRGRALAREERLRFAEFSRCLFGGTIAQHPGVGLPSGDRDHFASQVVYAPSEWPLSCRAPLRALAPKPAVFLWPAVKSAGADLRAVAAFLEDELVALHRARSAGAGSIPTRPLDAFAKLQAAMTLMARATDITDDLDDDALRFETPSALAAPARLPLLADDSALLDLKIDAAGLEALALDSRGLSWLQVDDGKVDHVRVRRQGLVRSIERSHGEAYVIWAMAPLRCKERDDRCAHRASGFARYERGAETLPAPRWLGGHPAGRADRTLHIDGNGNVDMISIADKEGRLALSHFEHETAPPAPGTNGEPAPLAASTTQALSEGVVTPSDAMLLDTRPVSLALATNEAAALDVRVVWAAGAEPARAPLVLAGLTAPAAGSPWVSACVAEHARWLVYGNDSALRVARIATEAEPVTALESQPRALAIKDAISAENPALDRVRLLCEDTRAWLFARDAHDTLFVSRCDATAQCTEPIELGHGLAAYSASFVHGVDGGDVRVSALVAFSGVSPNREIRVLRLDADGKPLGPASIPSACWNPFGGTCGMPTLVQDGQRTLLVARDAQDLLVLESSDAGAHFAPLSDLKVGTALDQTAHDPLQQHRLRKGIE